MIPLSPLRFFITKKWLVALALLMSVSTGVFAQATEFRGIWVDAWGTGFLNASQVTTLVNHCRTYNFNAVVVQMRRRGDAFYMPQAPNLEPRTTAVASDFDALQEIINQCNTGSPRIEVHCWTPTFLVGDSSSPNKANHVMNVHPEYLMKDSAGQTFIGEGYYLDPGNPQAQKWNYNMAKDIVSRYNVDGYHWDYIRYPTTDAGYNDTAIARYNAEYGLTGQPATSSTQFSNWRRRQVTDFLRWVNADLMAVKTNLIISASVFGSRSDAFNARFQDWATWNNEGIIDICMPMVYTDDNSVFQSRVNDAYSNQGVRRVYAGMGAYLNTKENTVWQLNYIRNKPFLGSMVYSYRVPNSGTVTQTTTLAYIRDNHQPTWVNTPTIPWKTSPTKGIVKGIVTRQDTGQPVYNATISINTSPVRNIKTDGHGSYGFYETIPGSYTVTASGTGLGSVNAPVTVAAGGIVTVNLVFPNDATPPVISSVAASGVTDSTAVISWVTDENASSIVEYGTTLSYGSLVSDTNRIVSHSMNLSGLAAATTYQFRVRSTDANTNEAVSANFTFTTNPSGVVNDVIVESRLAGGALNANPPYSESGFADSTLKSSAAGLTGTGSRYASSGTPAFTITPTLAVSGATYDVYLTHGVATSISDDVVVAVSGSGHTGLPATTTIFREPGGNTWELLGRMKLNSGVTSPTLTFTRSSGVLSGNDRMYSDAIKFVYVPTAPAFDTQPQNQTANYGSSASFTVQVSGTAPFAYQWKKNGVNVTNGGRISGATSSTLIINDLVSSDADNYSVSVSNSVGSTGSATATLTVTDPVIVTQPSNTTNTFGTSANFTVAAVGSPILTYQWKKGNLTINDSAKYSGTTTPTLTINDLTLLDTDSYSVVVANGSGSVPSAQANLVVSAAPVIGTHPQSQNVSAGTPVSFTVSVQGAAPMTFQWQKNNVNLNNDGNVSGATTDTLTLSTTGPSDEGAYRVVIVNSFGNDTSNPATLTVVSPPVISSQPTNQTNRGGTTAIFTVAVTGTAPFTYQWTKNGDALSNGGNISGASTATLSIANVSQADAANYQVTISNSAGSAISATASLIVKDGDITIFHDTFESGNMDNWTQTTGTAGTSLVNDNTRNADPAGGSRSAKMDSSADRMHRNIIADNGGTELNGPSRVTFYIYDPGSGSTADRIFSEVRGYSGTGLPNGGITADGGLSQLFAAGKYNAVTMTGETFTTNKYQGRLTSGGNSGWFNLNAAGSPNRSTGWHKFEIERLGNGTTILFYVDGILSRTITGATAQTWDTIILGPGVGSTAGDAWIDGFKVEKVGASPIFTASPQPVAANAGQTVSFSAMVTGAGPFTYQWKKDGGNVANGGRISGANSLTLTIVGAELGDAGSYTLFASNADGNATSSAATLTISDIAPAIVAHPASRTNNFGTVATFSVEATGTSLAYEWKKNETILTDTGNFSGTSTATLTISDVRQADVASYRVRVFNTASSVESDSASLTVIDPPTITLQPAGATRNAGQTMTFTTAATGTDVSFQWRRNGTPLSNSGNISGATTATLTITDVLSANAGTYSVLASNSAGNETSADAVLVVNDPIIVSQPSAYVATFGQSATFTVAAYGTEVLSYQWRKDAGNLNDGENISGANTATLTIDDVQNSDLGTYSVIVTSEAGGSITSQNAELLTGSGPTITTHPLSRTNNVGTTATFSVTATGDGTLTYIWKKDGTNLVNGGKISGATTTALSISDVAVSNAGVYTVVVSNGAGLETSDPATLVINTDLTLPTVKITAPASKQRLLENVHVTNYVTRIYGTAADNVGVTRVIYSLNEAPFADASGTLNWHANVTLVPGTNSIVVHSIDNGGNLSAQLARSFFYVVPSTLTASVKGGLGSIVNNLNGQALDVGVNYKMTAVPASTNYVFTNWTHIVAGQTNYISDNPLIFTMQSNLVLEANLLPNPFGPASGIYNGLFYRSDEVTHDSAGHIIMKVSPKMTFSGKLLLDGNAVSVSGKFDVSGTATREISRAKFGKTNLVINFALDFADSTDQAIGTIQQGSDWTADFTADRYVWSTNNVPVQYTNSYTVSIPGLSNAAEEPVGHGYGINSVDSIGRIKFIGGAADGHIIKQSSYLSKNGEWPFYVPLYLQSRLFTNSSAKVVTLNEHQGSLIGWVTFAANTGAGKTNLAPQGTLKWIKTGWTNTVYPNGFTNTTIMKSSRHLAPPLGTPVVDMNSAQMIMSDGNLASPFSNGLAVSEKNAFVFTGPVLNTLKPALAAKTGLMKGTFTHPGNSHAITKFFGVVLQDYNYGRGYFVGPTQGGSVTLDEN